MNIQLDQTTWWLTGSTQVTQVGWTFTALISGLILLAYKWCKLTHSWGWTTKWFDPGFQTSVFLMMMMMMTMMMMMLGFCMIVCVMGPYGFYIFWPCGLDQFHDRSSPHAMTAMESCHSLYIAYVASRSTLAMRHRYPKNSEDQILVYEFTDRCLWEAQRARQNSGWTAKMKKHNFTTNFKAFFLIPPCAGCTWSYKGESSKRAVITGWSKHPEITQAKMLKSTRRQLFVVL